jgi:hypothetical protein
MEYPIKSDEVQRALELSKRLGLMGSWTKRVGVAKDSNSIEDIKNTKTLTRQSSILVGLDVGLST